MNLSQKMLHDVVDDDVGFVTTTYSLFMNLYSSGFERKLQTTKFLRESLSTSNETYLCDF